MPNLKGGKNYKKMKHAQGAKPELHDIGEGQMIGKVMRLLGDRQAQVYCNDNVERICKIRGKLRKKVWIATGDIVLLSLRILSSTLTEEEDSDDDIAQAAPATSSCSKGDILAKYDPDVYSKLKKLDGVNKKLFGGTYDVAANDEDIFDTEDAHDDDAGSDSSDDVPNSRKRLPWSRGGAATAAPDDDVDIDAI
jgi:translation initiation factor 1A